MTKLLLALQVFALSALVASGDDKKDPPKGVPDHLKGEWEIFGAANGKKSLTVPAGGASFTIGAETMEWKSLPLLENKPGKATIKAKGKSDAGTLELKIGEKLYNGIYRVIKPKNNTSEDLEILLGLEGKPGPKEFPKTVFDFPTDASLYLQSSRKKRAP